MDIQLQSFDGSKAGSITVSDALLDREYNESLVHQVVTAYLAGARSGTVSQKHDLKYAVAVESHSHKKVVAEHVPVQSEVHYGVQVVQLLLQSLVIIVKKLTVKYTVMQCVLFCQNYVVKTH